MTTHHFLSVLAVLLLGISVILLILEPAATPAALAADRRATSVPRSVGPFSSAVHKGKATTAVFITAIGSYGQRAVLAQAANSELNPAAPNFPADADFVVAIGSYGKRMVLAQASRAWRSRGGIRALIATNASDAKAANMTREHALHHEVYVHRPDVKPIVDGNPWLAGDLRAAAVPFLAHAAFGDTYKWMLYGDDDTVWYMDQVRTLLAAFDPNEAWAITDNLWKGSQHPSFEAPRCLPCHLKDFEMPDSKLVPKAACPSCKRADICLGGAKTCEAPGAHGGAGIILSVGLMRRIQLADAEDCIATSKGCTGGDCIFSQCLAERWGIGFTDPGHSVLSGFDAQRVIFDNQLMRDVFEDPLDMLIKGTCDAACKWLLRHGVSHHFKVRGSPTRKLERVAAVVYRLVASNRAALAYLDLLDSRRLSAAHDHEGGEAHQERQRDFQHQQQQHDSHYQQHHQLHLSRSEGRSGSPHHEWLRAERSADGGGFVMHHGDAPNAAKRLPGAAGGVGSLLPGDEEEQQQLQALAAGRHEPSDQWVGETNGLPSDEEATKRLSEEEETEVLFGEPPSLKQTTVP